MFENARGVAVIAASDLDRARSFYEGMLGLTPEEIQEEAEAVIYRLGGSAADGLQDVVRRNGEEHRLRDSRPRPGRATWRRCGRKGWTFLEYDFPGLKTVDGVAELGDERSAWFADSEGNILGLFQRA